MRLRIWITLVACCVICCNVFGTEYCVVVSKKTNGNAEWKQVVTELVKKHKGAEIVELEGSPLSALEALRKAQPRYVVFVAQPEELDREYVLETHRVSRRLDDDPYGDCIWGIITGYSPADALRIAKVTKPLNIATGLGTTGFQMDKFREALVISDGKNGMAKVKQDGGEPKETMHEKGPKGLTYLFQEFWDEQNPDFLVTSSHATSYNLEMPFGNGLIASYGNKFYVLRRDQKNQFAQQLGRVIRSGNDSSLKKFLESLDAPILKDGKGSRVWIGAGNCLLGDVRRSKNTMAITALSSGGVTQLVGYTVPSWYGKMGWGTFKRFFSSNGRLTLAEAFFFQSQYLIEETKRQFPKCLEIEFNAPSIDHAMKDREFGGKLQATGYQDKKNVLGMVHDRDVVAFFGDPKWEARLGEPAADDPLVYDVESDTESVTIKLKANDGYEGKGLDLLLPIRLKGATLSPADGIEYLLADDFLQITKTDLAPGDERTIVIKK